MKIKLTIVRSSLRKRVLTTTMKVFILLFCTTVFSFNTENSFSQEKVKIDRDQLATVAQVFVIIQNQTDYDFIYPKRVFKNTPKIQLKKGEILVVELLKKSLLNNNMDFDLIDGNIVIVKREAKFDTLVKENQGVQLTGTVNDASGQPLPGANIIEKGTQNGTQTDFDGKFSLNVSDGQAILVVSYLGFVTKEIAVSNQTTISITLQEDAAKLEEVVVIGYGTQKKIEVTGAVAQVKGSELTKAPISTLTNALTGRLPGLTVRQTSAEPGLESTEVLVRGSSTFGNNSALIVIDGVAGRDGLTRIDPNDIESISVLKDASAAIYGARAANGVILITTKRGKTGKPQVSYSFNSSFNSPISLPKHANGLEYAQFLNLQSWANSDWDPNYTRFATDTELGDIRSGVTPSYDWLDIAYKNSSFQQSHNVSVRGGSDKVKYFVSARYLDQGSLFEEDEIGGNTQYNVRSNIDLKVSDNLDIALDLAARQQDVETANGRGSIFSSAPLTPPLVAPFVNNDPSLPSAGRATQNPLAVVRGSGYNETENNVYNGTIKFNYKLPFLDGLAIGGFASVDVNTGLNKSFSTPFSYYVENTDGTVEERKSGGTTPKLNQSYRRGRQITTNFRTTFTRLFGEHNIDALLQVEKQTGRGDRFNAFNNIFLSPAVDQFGAGSGDRNDTGVGGSASESVRIGYSGRLNYNYKGKYLAQFLFRYDGSEIFEPGQRFGFFPGASLGWVVSEENFLKDVGFIQSLKLRASWGQLGNDRIGRFQYLSTFGFGNNLVVNNATVSGVRERGTANPGVTWETTESRNIGLEASLFSGKVNLEFDLFSIKTRDILASPNETQPNYTGLPNLQRNIGTHENRGFELATSYQDNIGELNFKIGGNVAFSRNKILNIDEPDREFEYQNQEGRPIGSGLWYHATGLFRTQQDLDNNPQLGTQRLGDVIIQDTNEDGIIDGTDQIRLNKTATPELTYGIIGELAWNNFDLSMLWQGASGGLRRLQSNFSEGNNGLSYLLYNAWTPDNVNSKWPRPTPSGLSGQNTDFYHTKTDYIRLKTLEIGYNLPTDILGHIGVSSFRIYASGYNVLTFDSLSDIGLTDPEQTQSFGWDFPNLKTFNLGATIKF